MNEDRLMSKEELVKILQKALEQKTGKRFSLPETWTIFKTMIFTPYHIASKNIRVSIQGVGVFTTLTAKATGRKHAKFYCSEGLVKALTDGTPILDLIRPLTESGEQVGQPKEEEPKKAVKKAPAKKSVKKVEEPEEVEEPKKPAKKSVKKAPAKKVEEPEPEVEDIDENDTLEDDFSADEIDDLDFDL